VRITLTVNGQTAVYTQYGDMIAPPVVQLSRSKQLLVTAARGADITIWKSSDLLVWSIVSNFTSPITAQQSSIILNTSSPFNFYRASIK
jgi:sucrose-6-phosphate hydrolase SacC (GH32 family)